LILSVPYRKKPQVLQKAHLLRYAVNLIAQRIFIYASLFGFCAPRI
jgi:hypothetical protein